jgi:ubiquinone/menaquinone biosynthesis C-methylase UbiE
MGRAVRIGLLIVTGAAVYLAVRGIRSWLAERRARTVFASADAQMLLNPLRRLIMPVGQTLDRFGVTAGKTVLEVGPGPGYYTLEAGWRLAESGRLVCLDIQRDMLERLRSRLEQAGVRGPEHLVADATQLPLATGTFDVAFLVTVLGEVPEPEAALGELRRILRPGGTLGFGESFGDPDYVLLKRLREMCAAQGFEQAAYYRGVFGYTATFRAPAA